MPRCPLCGSREIDRYGVCLVCGWEDEPDDGMTYENRDFDHETAIDRDFF